MNDNLELWNAYGNFLIPVMPFMDNIIDYSEGNYLVDIEGNRILDLASGQFCSILGHNNKEFVKSLSNELEKNLHLGSQYVSRGVLETAKMIVDRAPGSLNHVIFLSTGSEANEFALRVAKIFTKRNGVVGFDRGYYGITIGTRSLSSISSGIRHVDATPRVPECFNLIAPNCLRCPLNLKLSECKFACLELSKNLIGDYLENIAAIFIETVISAGGMIFPSVEYIKEIRKFSNEIGALLIVDEAQTGFGRCGKWFDCENLGIEPDILVFSKTSGNGYPSSGVIIRHDIQTKLISKGFYHLSSHQNDPLACRAVKSVIEIIENQNLLDNANKMGLYFMRGLESLEIEHDTLTNVRGRGLMISFDLVRDKKRKVPYLDMLNPFILACKHRGVHLTYTYFEGSIRILPSLTINKKEIDSAIDTIRSVLIDLESGKLDSKSNLPKNQVTKKIISSNKLFKLGTKIWETSPKELFDKVKNRI